MTLAAYIDETGDRGSTKPSASPIFGMAAIVADPPAERAARAALSQLRVDLNTPPTRPLSWKKDLKGHSRRTHAAKTFEKLKDFKIKVIYVCNDKSKTRAGTYTSNHELFYSYVAYYTLERILRTANAWPGGCGMSMSGSVRYVASIIGLPRTTSHSRDAASTTSSMRPHGGAWPHAHGCRRPSTR